MEKSGKFCDHCNRQGNIKMPHSCCVQNATIDCVKTVSSFTESTDLLQRESTALKSHQINISILSNTAVTVMYIFTFSQSQCLSIALQQQKMTQSHVGLPCFIYQ